MCECVYLCAKIWPGSIHHNPETKNIITLTTMWQVYCMTSLELVILLVVRVNCWNKCWSSSKLGQQTSESLHCILYPHPHLLPCSNSLKNSLTTFLLCSVSSYIYSTSVPGSLRGYLPRCVWCDGDLRFDIHLVFSFKIQTRALTLRL